LEVKEEVEIPRSRQGRERKEEVAMPPSPSNSHKKEKLIALGAFLSLSIGAFLLVQNEVKDPYMVRSSQLSFISFQRAHWLTLCLCCKGRNLSHPSSSTVL